MDQELLAELDDVTSPALTCVERFVDLFGEDKRDTILTAINHPGPGDKISSALRKRGIVISNKAIYRHRRKECGCFQ